MSRTEPNLDTPPEKIIHDEAQCLLKCSRCKEMFDYFSVQPHTIELIHELRVQRASLIASRNGEADSDPDNNHVNG